MLLSRFSLSLGFSIFIMMCLWISSCLSILGFAEILVCIDNISHQIRDVYSHYLLAVKVHYLLHLSLLFFWHTHYKYAGILNGPIFCSISFILFFLSVLQPG